MERLLTFLKQISDYITTFSAAGILVIHFFQLKPVKTFLKTLSLMFLGTKSLDGKRVFGWKALNEEKEAQTRTQTILKAVAPDCKTEKVLVLNPDELIDLLCKLGIVTTAEQRKL